MARVHLDTARCVDAPGAECAVACHGSSDRWRGAGFRVVGVLAVNLLRWVAQLFRADAVGGFEGAVEAAEKQIVALGGMRCPVHDRWRPPRCASQALPEPPAR